MKGRTVVYVILAVALLMIGLCMAKMIWDTDLPGWLKVWLIA